MEKDNYQIKRVFGLDIFRTIAIVLVVLLHSGFLLRNTVLENFPYIDMIDGVDLFFVLSGFLIGGILLKEINSEVKFGIRQLKHFWGRRWLRTLPNYYLIFIVYHGIIHEYIGGFNWKFFFFLQNFSKPFAGFFWESWSLSVEEWFYIFSPLLLLIFLKFLKPKESFISITIIMIVFSFVYRVLSLNYAIDNFWYGETYHKLVVMRLDSIAYGLLAAWFFYYHPYYWVKFRISSLIIGLSLVLFVANYKVRDNTFYREVTYFSLSPIAAMLLLPFAQSIKKGKTVKIITHISKISYSMYLLNLAVAEVFRDNFPSLGGNDGLFKYILYWVIVITGSTLLYKYFEKPIMNLRNRKQDLTGT